MGNKYLIIVLVLVVLTLVGGGYYWQAGKQKPATVTTGTASPSATPTIDNGTEVPTENSVSANPYEKTNPFSDIKVNPFE